MAHQKLLMIAVTLVAMLGICQQVSAAGPLARRAIETLYSKQRLSLKETERLLQVIENDLGPLANDREDRDAYFYASEYLNMCKQDEQGNYGNPQGYFDMFFDSVIEHRRLQGDSPSIMNYLIDCQKRRKFNKAFKYPPIPAHLRIRPGH